MADPDALIEELRGFAAGSESARATLMRDAADALVDVIAERNAAIRDLDAGFAESDHLSAKYYQRMRDAEREMHTRELHHFEEEQKSAALEADLARAREAIAACRPVVEQAKSDIVQIEGEWGSCRGWDRLLEDRDPDAVNVENAKRALAAYDQKEQTND